jgi:hypothetical protein
MNKCSVFAKNFDLPLLSLWQSVQESLVPCRQLLVFVWRPHGINVHLAMSRDPGLAIFKGKRLLVFIRSMWISKWGEIKIFLFSFPSFCSYKKKTSRSSCTKLIHLLSSGL